MAQSSFLVQGADVRKMGRKGDREERRGKKGRGVQNVRGGKGEGGGSKEDAVY